MTIAPFRDIHTRLWIGRTDGVTWTDVTGCLSKVDVELGDVSGLGVGGTGTDLGVRRMTFTLRNDGDPLSPHVKASSWNLLNQQYSPLLWPMREVILDVATMVSRTTPGDTEPGDTDWVRLFHGYLGDRIQVSGDSVTCECRDLAKRLQNCWIEEVRRYGSTVGVAAETVIQKLLDHNLGTGVVQLNCPQASGFMVQPYEVEYQSVWDAIQQVASQIGWFLGYRWTGSDFKLTLMAPPRTKSTADWTFTAEDDIYVQDLDINDADIRNVVQVTYRNRATQRRRTVQVEDAASIAEYGRRAMGIAEADASLIDTEAEALALANAALADLSDMTGTTQVDLPLFPQMDLFTTFTTEYGRLSSTMDCYAADSVRHALDFEGGRFRTTVIASRKVVGARTKWLAMQTRPGAGEPPRPPESRIMPAPPTGLTVVAAGLEDVSQVTLAYVDLAWDPVENVACDEYRVEYRVQGTAHWESRVVPLGTETAPQRVSGLPGTTPYEFRVCGISRWGVVGEPSPVQAYTTPRDMQAPEAPTVSAASIVGGVAVYTSEPTEPDWDYDEVDICAGASIADDWKAMGDTDNAWFQVDTGTSHSGIASQCIIPPRFMIVSMAQTVPAAAGQSWVFGGHSKRTSETDAHAKIEFLSSSGDVLSGQQVSITWSSSFVAFGSGTYKVAPTGTVAVRLVLMAMTTAPGVRKVWYDDVYLQRAGYANALSNPGFEYVGGRLAGWTAVARGRQTYFEITDGMEVGQPVVARAYRVDTSGNRSEESNTATAIAGMVQTAHIYESAVSAVQSYISAVETGTWTSSTSLVDVPGVSVPFDLEEPAVVTIWFTAMGVAGTSTPFAVNKSQAQGRWELNVDGDRVGYQNLMGHGGQQTSYSGGPMVYPTEGAVTMSWTAKLGRGSHVAKVQFMTKSAGTGTNWVGTYSPTLIVQVLKR